MVKFTDNDVLTVVRYAIGGELLADDEIIFHEGGKPIRASKNWFFKDRMFKQRAGLAPVVVEVVKKVADPAASGKIVIQPETEREAKWLQ